VSRRHLLVLCLAAMMIAALAVLGAGSAVAAPGKRLTATLTGAAEVPGPGDPDGLGTARIRINPGQQTVCYTVSWANLDAPVWGGHIHVGDASTAGGVVVTLFGGPILPNTDYPGTFTVSDCTTSTASSAQLADIIDNPSGYYVNLHNDVYPGGAIRGQLSEPPGYAPNPPRVQSGGIGTTLPSTNTSGVLGQTEDLGRTEGLLPFTGADLTLFVVIGALAVGSGIVILRRTRSSRRASQS
jgi:hypothetical protein